MLSLLSLLFFVLSFHSDAPRLLSLCTLYEHSCSPFQKALYLYTISDGLLILIQHTHGYFAAFCLYLLTFTYPITTAYGSHVVAFKLYVVFVSLHMTLVCSTRASAKWLLLWYACLIVAAASISKRSQTSFFVCELSGVVSSLRFAHCEPNIRTRRLPSWKHFVLCPLLFVRFCFEGLMTRS